MKNVKLCIVAMVLIATNASAQFYSYQKVYGLINSGGNSIQPTSDGGYIMCGTIADSTGGWNIYLLKLDAPGNTIWTKTYATPIQEYGIYAKQCSDGGYIITGYSGSVPSGRDIYLIRTDASGTVTWSKKYGGGTISRNESWQVHQCTDGGFVVCGFTIKNSSPPYASNAYLIKTNAGGDTIWTKTYCSDLSSQFQSVEQTPDGGFIAAGSASDTLGSITTNVFLVKTNASGDTTWTKTFGGTSGVYLVASSVKRTSDGGYILTGKTSSFGAGNDDMFLTKTDVNGVPLWTKTYGFVSADRAVAVIQTSDGGYVISGSVTDPGFSNSYYGLIKTDVNGNLNWAKMYGISNANDPWGMSTTSDGGYIMTGGSNSLGENKILVVKTNALGGSGCYENGMVPTITTPVLPLTNIKIKVKSFGWADSIMLVIATANADSTLCHYVGINEHERNEGVSVYPNPFFSETTILSDVHLNDAILTIENYLGQEVRREERVSGRTVTLSRGDLPAGMYLFRLIENNKRIAVKKLVIVD